MTQTNNHPPAEPLPTDQSVPVEPVAHADLRGDEPATAPEADLDEDSDGEMAKMTLGEHLEDLRKRLFYCILGLFLGSIVGLALGGPLLEWITAPFHAAMAKIGRGDDALNVTQVAGAFSMYLRVGLYFGLVAASPWIFYHIWMFVGAGLYKRERRWVELAVPFSALLFLLGAAFAVRLSIPAIEFFVGFGVKMGIKPIITLDDYVEFMIKLVLAFGVIFQMPLVVLVLSKVGIADMKRLHYYRRHVIVACAAISALLAPPDVLSMIAMLLPMWVLYEVGILLSWLLIFRRR